MAAALSGHSNDDAFNSTVLRWSQNAFSDETALALDGREFHAHGKARSTIVHRQVDSTVSVDG